MTCLKSKNLCIKNITNSQSIYFYAHLSTIDVEKGDVVDAKTILGKTGSTGNAKGMTTISKGDICISRQEVQHCSVQACKEDLILFLFITKLI